MLPPYNPNHDDVDTEPQDYDEDDDPEWDYGARWDEPEYGPFDEYVDYYEEEEDRYCPSCGGECGSHEEDCPLVLPVEYPYIAFVNSVPTVVYDDTDEYMTVDDLPF